MAIKGWKNAQSDIMRARRNAATAEMNVKLVQLRKDGQESGMHDAKSWHASVDDAIAKHNRLRENNPKRNIQHNLYVKGVLQKKLTEDVPGNAVSSGAIAGLGQGPQGEPPVRPKAMKKYKDKNAEEAPKLTPGRKSFLMFMQGI